MINISDSCVKKDNAKMCFDVIIKCKCKNAADTQHSLPAHSTLYTCLLLVLADNSPDEHNANVFITEMADGLIVALIVSALDFQFGVFLTRSLSWG